MATKKEIQKRFAQYFPQLANVKLRTARLLLGPSVAPVMGLERLRTVAYLLGVNPLDESIVPISGEVKEWKEIKALLWPNRCVTCLYNMVVIEKVTMDHSKGKQIADYHLRSL